MKDYKSKVNSYPSPKGEKWRVEYAYKTPDGVYHRSCKRGFDSFDQADNWRMRHLYRLIDEKEKEISIPIIMPAAEKAAKGRRIAVIATERTVRSAVFTKEISKISNADIIEFPAQRLVALVEGGCRDGRINNECDEELNRISKLVNEAEADTLILGCTHFSHLEKELQKSCNINTVSPAREGAIAMVNMITKSHTECGRSIYI